jgi:streptogramin lyase
LQADPKPTAVHLIAQMQRHLQHSLEVHQRYIHRLMEQEGLAHKIPEMSAALQAGAAAQPASLASEAMSVQPLQRAGSLQQPIDQQQQQHAAISSGDGAVPAGEQVAANAGVAQQAGSSKQQQRPLTTQAAQLPGSCEHFLADNDQELLNLGFNGAAHSNELRLPDEQPAGKRHRVSSPQLDVAWLEEAGE